MTDEPSDIPDPRAGARQNRLGAALRENLKRRKTQFRGRAARVSSSASETGIVHIAPPEEVSRDDTA